ncbi:UNVERIFIED_CONTAM: hypothetical protein HDU68_008038 [Siphonaria sp. JEL0065]|nr:hypothetical protein HDU68_008038 [Siphonaria sp. JEL0065]
MSVVSCLSDATPSVVYSSSKHLFAKALAFEHNTRPLASSGHPLAFTYPANEMEASAIIKCAAKFNINLSARSGGHSYEAYSIVRNSIVVDMANFTEISIDSVSETAVIGAGNWLGRVYLELENNGRFVIPGGTCPSVGIGGHSLGGGYGVMSRQLGLVSDAILEVRLIDAEGLIRVVDSQTDPELFWAIRGAGANNFGLITSFKFKIFKLPSAFASKVWSWPNTIENRHSVLSTFSEHGPSLPNEFFAGVNIRGASLSLGLLRLGRLDGFDEASNGFLSKMPPKPKFRGQREFFGHVDVILSGYPTMTREMLQDRSKLRDNQHYKATSILTTGGAPSKEGLTALTENGPIAIGSKHDAYVALDLWGGAISNILPNETSFVHRAKDQIGYQLWWGSNNSLDVSVFDEWREKSAAHLGRNAYQNYVDARVPLVNYYGAAGLEKLQKIKTRMDPKNLFKFDGGVIVEQEELK